MGQRVIGIEPARGFSRGRLGFRSTPGEGSAAKVEGIRGDEDAAVPADSASEVVLEEDFGRSGE